MLVAAVLDAGKEITHPQLEEPVALAVVAPLVMLETIMERLALLTGAVVVAAAHGQTIQPWRAAVMAAQVLLLCVLRRQRHRLQARQLLQPAAETPFIGLRAVARLHSEVCYGALCKG